MKFAVNVIFQFSFSPLNAICVPFGGVFTVKFVLWDYALSTSVRAWNSRCRTLLSPVCVRSSKFWIRAFGFHDVNFATIRPVSIFFVARTHPETRPGALVLWHFYASFNIAIFKVCFTFCLYEARSKVSSLSVAGTSFTWFI